MNIEVGSKWVRSKLYRSFPNSSKSYFLGQEFEVEGVTSGFVRFRRDHPLERGLTGNLAKARFLEHFTPINITLENK